MNLSTQQQSQVADVNQDLWEAKLLSITGDEIDDILNAKDTASPPMSFDMPMSTVQYSSDASHALADDILAQAIAQELGFLNKAKLHDDAQPTHSREALIQQDLNVNNLQPPVKPTHSRDAIIQQNGKNADKTSPPYMKMIAESIMASPIKRVVLSQVYSYVGQRYPKFTGSKGSWKNSVRRNLSTNKCFQKCGRALSGRGYIWEIHPACLQMFQCGNFIRLDALCEVYRYESENRMSVDGQQTRNIGVSLRPQSIPQQQPQSRAVTTSARMPHQHQQMQQTQVYVPPMQQVGTLSNTQGIICKHSRSTR